MKSALKYIKSGLVSLIMISCNNTPLMDNLFLPQVNLRESLNKINILPLKDEIESVSYIPLKETADDASIIDGVASYTITSKHIYLLPVKEARIVKFDRKGHFIKTIINKGQGPNEFNGVITNIQADEKNDRLYLYNTENIWEYTLDGKFINKHTHEYLSVLTYKMQNDKFAAVALPYVPFKTGSFGLGIFTKSGDEIITKNNFTSEYVSMDKAGFTIRIATVPVSTPCSILFKAGCNDTIFRITENSIVPTCVVKLNNSKEEIINSLDVTNFKSMSLPPKESDIIVTDLMETSRRIYIRFQYENYFHVASLDKKTGIVYIEKCCQPVNFSELSDANLLMGMVGTLSFNNFPIWGQVIGQELVQVVSPYELSLYSNSQQVEIPSELQNIDEYDNPIFIIYKLK